MPRNRRPMPRNRRPVLCNLHRRGLPRLNHHRPQRLLRRSRPLRRNRHLRQRLLRLNRRRRKSPTRLRIKTPSHLRMSRHRVVRGVESLGDRVDPFRARPNPFRNRGSPIWERGRSYQGTTNSYLGLQPSGSGFLKLLLSGGPSCGNLRGYLTGVNATHMGAARPGVGTVFTGVRFAVSHESRGRRSKSRRRCDTGRRCRSDDRKTVRPRVF